MQKKNRIRSATEPVVVSSGGPLLSPTGLTAAPNPEVDGAQRHRVRRNPVVLTLDMRKGKGSPGNDSDSSGHLQVEGDRLSNWGSCGPKGWSKHSFLLVLPSPRPTTRGPVGSAQQSAGTEVGACRSKRGAQETRKCQGSDGGVEKRPIKLFMNAWAPS